MLKSLLIAATLLTTLTANASLIDRGNGLIYDTDLDITWLQDANSRFLAPVGGSWWDVSTSISRYEYFDSTQGITWNEWRLPNMDVNGDTSVIDCSTALKSECADNEMGYMYYQNLNGVTGDVLMGSQVVDGVSINNINALYWSAGIGNELNQWLFDFSSGGQFTYGSNVSIGHAWAVHDGDIGAIVSAVPLPASIWLLGSGLLGLIGIAKRKVNS